jgi:predicted metal-binding membrane protein
MKSLLRTPERLVMALVALAWLWMLGDALTARRFTCCAPHPSAAEDLRGWIAMIVAMMMPAAVAGIADVARRSYRVRRLRAAACYVAGFVAWWLVFGVAVVAGRRLAVAHDPRAATVFCLFAVLWAFVPMRQRWHVRCHHMIPLCPVGRRADVDAFRQGAIHGAPCVAICWPVMMACAVTNHSLVLMIAGALLAWTEKRAPRVRPGTAALGNLALAGWTLLL